jgi:hypothetical protein
VRSRKRDNTCFTAVRSRKRELVVERVPEASEPPPAHDQLDRATQDVPTTPDLGTSLRRGRTRRRQRSGLVAGAGLVAGTAAAALVLVAALGGASHDAGAPVAPTRRPVRRPWTTAAS